MPERHVDLGAVIGQDGRRIVGGAERPAVVDPVDDQKVAPLAGQLGPAQFEGGRGRVAGLGGEADDHRTTVGAPSIRPGRGGCPG